MCCPYALFGLCTSTVRGGLYIETPPCSPTPSAFLKTPGNRKRLIVIVAIGAGTQLVGNGLVAYYLAPILKLIGITQPAQQAGINGGLAIFNLIVAVIAAQFVERLGRRPLWLAGNIGMLC